MKKILLYYFLFLLSVFLILSSGVIDSQDGFQYLAVARNIYYTGKPTAPVYEYNERKNVHMSTYIGKDGNTYSPTGLGFSLAMLPAVAIADIVYKIYGVSPPVHFPLESDWLIFMLASFTNAFFASFLGIILFLYLLEIGLSKKQALFISFVGLFTTNLFVYAKYSFAHMMFNTFLFSSFFLVKKNFKTEKKVFLILAGMTFGLTSLIYNLTFLLTLIPLGFYFLFLGKFRLNFISIKILSTKLLLFLVASSPFIVIYFWFENTRAGSALNLGSPLSLASRAVSPFVNFPFTVFLEGLFGQLFSPGRSIFLYSPILLLIILFWHRIKKVIFPEFLLFLILSAVSIIFYATLYSTGKPGQGITGLWHGESSWGPRYLTTLIPFGLLAVGFIFTQLKKVEKLVVVLPLLLLGLYIEILGLVMPYQIKFHDLQDKFYVNSTEFTNFAYSNFLPRYSPIIMMSKKLVKLAQTLPKTLDHGVYNVRFYDGIDFPFPVGGERWRVIDQKGYISFDNSDKNPVKKISLGLINHPVEDASYSAVIQISLNNNPLLEKPENLLVTKRKVIDLTIPDKYLQPINNKLVVDVKFKSTQDDLYLSEKNQYKDDPSLYSNKNVQPNKYIPQILGIISFSINGIEINKESLDFPYISPLGPAMAGISYQTYGGTNKDPWKSWDIHTQIYERVPDFWWFKALYYWDLPKLLMLLLFVSLFLSSIYFGFKTFKYISKNF